MKKMTLMDQYNILYIEVSSISFIYLIFIYFKKFYDRILENYIFFRNCSNVKIVKYFQKIDVIILLLFV